MFERGVGAVGATLIEAEMKTMVAAVGESECDIAITELS